MHLRTLIVCVCIIVCSVLAVSAQDAPEPAVRAAERAVRALKPDIGSLQGTAWARLNPTTNSALLCPLVQGQELGREVTVWALTLDFEVGEYVVHVSTDGSLAQPCDPDFGTLVASTPAPPSGCQIASAAQPTFRIAPDGSTAILGGEVMVNGVAYAIGRMDTKEWYQTRNTAGQIGWVSAKEITLSGDCESLPITGAQNIDYVTIPCFITTAADVSNVRQFASTDAEILARIYENAYWQVYATTTDGQWYFINPGWVAARVAEQYGDCDNLEVNNNLVGVIPGTPTPVPTITATMIVSPTPFPTSTAAALVSPTVFVSSTPRPTPAPLTCPGNPAGFLPPRLRFGEGTARVSQGGTPNRLRAEPSTQALQVGQVQPGRTLDAVINGPVCNETYVWWFVQIDGVQGWTVESDSADGGAYFLEPVGGVPTIQAGTAQPTAASTRIIAAPEGTSEAGDSALPEGVVLQEQLGDPEKESSVLGAVRVLPDGTIIAKGTELSVRRPDAEANTWTTVGADVAAFDVTADRLFILDGENTLFTYDLETLEELSAETVPLSPVLQGLSPRLDFTSDGRYFLASACGNADCTQGQIDLWETETLTLIRSQPAHPYMPAFLAFSPDDRVIVSQSYDGIQLWNTQSGAFISAMPESEGYNMPPVFAPDSSAYYYLSCARLVNQSDCSQTDLFIRPADAAQDATQILIGEALSPRDLAVSADGSRLAVGVRDNVSGEMVIQLWAVAADGALTQVSSFTLPRETPIVLIYMAFTPDGSQLVIGDNDGLIQVWDVPNTAPNDAG